MRKLSHLLLMAAVLVLATFASDHSPEGPFSITISAEKPEVRTGTEIYISITMKNTSDHDLDCTMAPTNGWDAAYQYEVRDERGTALERKPLVPEHPEIKENSSIWTCLLKPGKTTSIDSFIGRRFDMSRPGKYRVQVSRLIDPRDKEHGVVKSNTITITVTP